MSNGLRDALSCPQCGGETAVYRRDAATGCRYRRCLECDHAFVTLETILSHYTVTRYARRKAPVARSAAAPAFTAQRDGAVLDGQKKGHPGQARVARRSGSLS